MYAVLDSNNDTNQQVLVFHVCFLFTSGRSEKQRLAPGADPLTADHDAQIETVRALH